MTKRAKTSKRRGPDFISSLPDPILLHILELLMTKEAVKTCVLSKRWEHLWTSLRSLHFDSNEFVDRKVVDVTKDDYRTKRLACLERFAKFVNAVLLRREPLNLDVFRMCCVGLYYENDKKVSDWIHYAVKHRTRVFYFLEVDPLPDFIYTCTSIEELHIDNCIVEISGTVNFPKLRKLVMRCGEDSPFPCNLLSGCPALECLEIDFYLLPDECVIAHGYLKHLSIMNCSTHRLSIDAPNLLSFSFVLPDPELEYTPPHEAILNTPSLIFACLETHCFEMCEHLGAMTSILGALSNAKLLKLHIPCNQLKELHRVQLQELPIFDKLENVTVAFCAHACFEMVAWILLCSPNLKKLTLVEKPCFLDYIQGTSGESNDVSLMAAITSCKKLEIIEVKYQKGCDQMVSQLVNALIDGTEELENLKIHLSKYKNCWKYSK